MDQVDFEAEHDRPQAATVKEFERVDQAGLEVLFRDDLHAVLHHQDQNGVCHHVSAGSLDKY